MMWLSCFHGIVICQNVTVLLRTGRSVFIVFLALFALRYIGFYASISHNRDYLSLDAMEAYTTLVSLIANAASSIRRF